MKEKLYCSFLSHNRDDCDAKYQDYDGIFRFACEALADTTTEENEQQKNKQGRGCWEKACRGNVYVSRRWLDDLPDPNGGDMYGHPIWNETQDGLDLYTMLEAAVSRAKTKDGEDNAFALGEETFGHDLIIFEQLETRRKFKRQGAASFLVNFAIRSFMSPSTTSLACCLVRKDNKEALKFWKAMKFTWKLGENKTIVLLGRPLMYDTRDVTSKK